MAVLAKMQLTKKINQEKQQLASICTFVGWEKTKNLYFCLNFLTILNKGVYILIPRVEHIFIVKCEGDFVGWNHLSKFPTGMKMI